MNLRVWALPLLVAVLSVAYSVGVMVGAYANPAGPWWFFSHLAVCGFPAVPLAAWLVTGLLDRQLEARIARPNTAALARLGIGVVLICVMPLAWSGGKLPPLGAAFTSLLLATCVASGILFVCFGLADGLFRLTSPFRHLSTRLMLLLVASTLGTMLFISILDTTAALIIDWAIASGGLEHYVVALNGVATLTTSHLGVAAGALVVNVPLTLLLAWRFAQNATRGITTLAAGFERVAQGDLDAAVPVRDNDEVAGMQRSFNGMLSAVRERRFLEAAFGRYVSPVLLAQLRDRSADLRSMPGQRRVATVLFSDIRGFTLMSAALPPEEVIAVLNAYMSLMIEVVARFDGYINKFVGDAIMIVWNAPLEQPKHALLALACAQAMHDELQRANAAQMFGSQTLEMGIGINSGPLVAGNLGNDRQTEFTVIGDTVNVASRVCQHALSQQVVLTSSVLEASGWGSGAQVRVDKLGVIPLKGRGEMDLYSLASTSAELVDSLQQGTALRKRPDNMEDVILTAPLQQSPSPP